MSVPEYSSAFQVMYEEKVEFSEAKGVTWEIIYHVFSLCVGFDGPVLCTRRYVDIPSIEGNKATLGEKYDETDIRYWILYDDESVGVDNARQQFERFVSLRLSSLFDVKRR